MSDFKVDHELIVKLAKESIWLWYYQQHNAKPELTKAIVELKERGMTGPAIAKKLGVSRNTVRLRHYKYLKQLKKCVEHVRTQIFNIWYTSQTKEQKLQYLQRETGVQKPDFNTTIH